jgi:hypothetical protein
VLLAQLLLGIAEVCLGLGGDQGARRADLALDARHRLAGGLADDVRDARQIGPGQRRAPQLLDSGADPALVVARLLEVTAQPLLVGLLLGQRYVGGQIRLELGFLGVSLVQPLDQLRVALVHGSHPRSKLTDAGRGSAGPKLFPYPGPRSLHKRALPIANRCLAAR